MNFDNDYATTLLQNLLTLQHIAIEARSEEINKILHTILIKVFSSMADSITSTLK